MGNNQSQEGLAAKAEVYADWIWREVQRNQCCCSRDQNEQSQERYITDLNQSILNMSQVAANQPAKKNLQRVRMNANRETGASAAPVLIIDEN